MPPQLDNNHVVPTSWQDEALARDGVSSEKVGLKLNIKKTKIMASGPITSWEIDGETVSDFIFLGSKITADGDCSHEIKRCLLLGRKVMTNLDSIFKMKKVLVAKLCPTLCDPMDCSPLSGDYIARLLHPWDFPAESTGVGCHCLL